MYLPKSPTAVTAALFAVASLAAALPASSLAAQAPATASHAAALGFYSPVDDPQPATFSQSNVEDNVCGISTFISLTSGASPFVKDCLSIVNHVLDKGHWQVEAGSGKLHQLVQSATCAFGVRYKSNSVAGYHIGSSDIVDIINDSIRMFASDGRVGSTGSMPCNDAQSESANVEWGLYHARTMTNFLMARLDSSGDAPSGTSASGLPAQTEATSPSTDPMTQSNATRSVTFQPENGDGALDDRCSNTLIAGETDVDSPRIDDCLVLAKNIASGGYWNVEAFVCRHHQLVQWGNCAFGVKAVCPSSGLHDWFFHVGNEDIIDVIHQSIDMFGADGRVAAHGTFKCQAAATPPTVEWGLYRIGNTKHEPRTQPYPYTAPNDTAPAMPAPNMTHPLPVFSTPANDTHPAVFLGASTNPGPQAKSNGDNECGLSTFEDQ
jgi:hypothetical protein